MTKEIVLNALLMAVWRRNPQKQVRVPLIRAVSQMPSAEYENLYYQRLRSVWIIRGNSVADNTSVTFYIRSKLTFPAQ